MEKKNKKYYQKQYYNHHHNNKKKKVEENKITYERLLEADTITENNKEDNYNKLMMVKYIAITTILFAIIFGSLLLFRKM